MPSRMDGDVYVTGNLSSKTMSIPSGTVDNDDVAAGAAIATSKMLHRIVIPYWQADGADIAAAIVPVYTCRVATAEIIAIEVAVVDAPSGGNEGFTVDLHIADEGAPTPASVLDAVVTYDDDQTDCEVLAGTISSADLVAGDSLLIVVAILGATGAKGQGLIVTLTIDESAS